MPAPPLTPKGYADQFLKMQVFLFDDNGEHHATPAGPSGEPKGKWVNTCVKTYRLGAASEKTKDPKKPHYYVGDLSDTVGHQKHILTRIKRIDGVVETQKYEFKQISYGLVAPFYGKGYPEEVQLALQMRYRFQKVKIPLDAFVKAAFIGLDCSGFVGGYLERRSSQSTWIRHKESKPSAPIRTLIGPPTGFYSSWNDFKPPGRNCLILALCDSSGNVKDHGVGGSFGHIVITEPNTMRKFSPTGPVKVDTVESTAAGKGGLQPSVYTFEAMRRDSHGKAYFHVDRGPGMGPKLWFRVSEVMH